MALKSEIILVYQVNLAQINVHNLTAAFDATQDESFSIGKTLQRSSPIGERRLPHTDGVEGLLKVLEVPNVHEFL